MKPLVYVAGPISGDPWGCVRQALAAEKVLEAAGCIAYLPQMSVLAEIVEHRPYEDWVQHGLAMVERCDALLRLPGKSKGAAREVEHARRLSIPVFDARLLPQWVKQWKKAHR